MLQLICMFNSQACFFKANLHLFYQSLPATSNHIPNGKAYNLLFTYNCIQMKSTVYPFWTSGDWGGKGEKLSQGYLTNHNGFHGDTDSERGIYLVYYPQLRKQSTKALLKLHYINYNLYMWLKSPTAEVNLETKWDRLRAGAYPNPVFCFSDPNQLSKLLSFLWISRYAFEFFQGCVCMIVSANKLFGSNLELWSDW